MQEQWLCDPSFQPSPLDQSVFSQRSSSLLLSPSNRTSEFRDPMEGESAEPHRAGMAGLGASPAWSHPG